MDYIKKIKEISNMSEPEKFHNAYQFLQNIKKENVFLVPIDSVYEIIYFCIDMYYAATKCSLKGINEYTYKYIDDMKHFTELYIRRKGLDSILSDTEQVELLISIMCVSSIAPDYEYEAYVIRQILNSNFIDNDYQKDLALSYMEFEEENFIFPYMSEEEIVRYRKMRKRIPKGLYQQRYKETHGE